MNLKNRYVWIIRDNTLFSFKNNKFINKPPSLVKRKVHAVYDGFIRIGDGIKTMSFGLEDGKYFLNKKEGILVLKHCLEEYKRNPDNISAYLTKRGLT